MYFAKDFEKLRGKVIPSGEDRYIRQLSRSVGHRPRGGKTRAEFYKTIGKSNFIEPYSHLARASYDYSVDYTSLR